MTNYVYIGASLDGYIAAPDGGLEWMDQFPHPEKSDYGYGAFMAGIDALVMGRATYEKVITFGDWPYEKPVFVLSNTMASLAPDIRGRAEVVSGPLPELVEALRGRGHEHLYIDGGRTITSFLDRDLIDEMIITTLPVLLGDGIPLFGKFEGPRRFRLKESQTFANSFNVRRYIRER